MGVGVVMGTVAEMKVIGLGAAEEQLWWLSG